MRQRADLMKPVHPEAESLAAPLAINNTIPNIQCTITAIGAVVKPNCRFHPDATLIRQVTWSQRNSTDRSRDSSVSSDSTDRSRDSSVSSDALSHTAVGTQSLDRPPPLNYCCVDLLVVNHRALLSVISSTG